MRTKRIIAWTIVVAIFVFGVGMSMWQSSDFENKCDQLHGRVQHMGKGHELCTDAEGRILTSR